MDLNLDELLLAESEDGKIAFHLAAEENHVETLKKLWVWAKEAQLNRIELKKKLLIEIDQYEKTAWQRMALAGGLEAFETLWSWAKAAELNTDELLLTQTGDGYTAFLLAAVNNHVGTLRKILVWDEETQSK